jgi:hypothetical protein
MKDSLNIGDNIYCYRYPDCPGIVKAGSFIRVSLLGISAENHLQQITGQNSHSDSCSVSATGKTNFASKINIVLAQILIVLF